MRPIAMHPPLSADLYRDPHAVQRLADTIAATLKHPISIMEVCGGQTHALARYGIEELLPHELRLIHGPGCPVCVTPISIIDLALDLARRPNIILCSYGDMLRVPGTSESLLSVKAHGGDIRTLYSPTDAVTLAQNTPNKEIVFFAVGFETTAPASALAVTMAKRLGLTNFSLLVAHVVVPPVLDLLLSTDTRPDALLAPGHVCAITGESEYAQLATTHQIPIAITGFEPIDLMRGILSCVIQLENGTHHLKNEYARVVHPDGNPTAATLMTQIFTPVDRIWRGLGLIPHGGMDLRPAFHDFDAIIKLGLSPTTHPEPDSPCRAGDILRGICPPDQCPAFGTTCTPLCPLGAPMVSSEGACAAYYRYKRHS
ncbi:MAG: hydrogenase formation protein HypD [Akkermansia sp.]